MTETETDTVQTFAESLEGSVRATTKALERLFSRLSKLSSFPAVALRVMQVANDERSDADDLLRVVEQDPTLAMRILRTVNSPYFGLSNKVADLKSAITLLGIREVRSLAMTVIASERIKGGTSSGEIDRGTLWNHAVGVASAARIIARDCHLANPEEAYLAGLLHEIGLCVIDENLGRYVPEVKNLVSTGVKWPDAEREILTFDHSQLGSYIAWRSGFPEHLVVAIDYVTFPLAYEGEERSLLNVLVLADFLATQHGQASVVSTPDEKQIPEAVLRSLGLSDERLVQLQTELESKITEAVQYAAV